MNNSGIVVENVFKGDWWDQNNRQINYAFMISHTFGQCDMCFVELQWYVSSNGNSTYSASSRAHTCSKKNFQDLCFLKLVQERKTEYVWILQEMS